jgi:hypothetical protein
MSHSPAQRRRRRPTPKLDRALSGQRDLVEWAEQAASFLVALEEAILAGEAKLPPSFYRHLNQLLRHP